MIIDHCFYADHPSRFDDKFRHLRLEVHFATAIEDGLSHVLDDTRQAVCANVRMGIRKDGRTGSVLNEDLQDAVCIASFLASGVKLSVAISSCPTLAKTVVAFWVNALFRTDAGNVLLPFANILTALNDDGLEA